MLKYKDGPIGQLRAEFDNALDPLARFAVVDLTDVMAQEFGVDMLITCVNRTPEANQAAGGVEKSAHLPINGIGRAVDLRSFHLTDYQEKFLTAYVKARWGTVIHCILHQGGTADHFHLNVNFQFSRAQASEKAKVGI